MPILQVAKYLIKEFATDAARMDEELFTFCSCGHQLGAAVFWVLNALNQIALFQACPEFR